MADAKSRGLSEDLWNGPARALVGTAAVILGIRVGEFFVALLLGWFVWLNIQQWQYFRTHGYPGD